MGNKASHQPGAQHAGAHPHNTNKVNRNTSAWRTSFLSPFVYFLGSCLWLSGAALLTSTEPRQGFEIDGVNGVDDDRYNSAGILFIIASCLWILASLVSIASAFAEVKLLKVGGHVPGIGRLLILSAWLELLGSILLLIGSALFLSANTTGVASAGAILILIGSFVWLLSMLILSVISLVVASVTSLMPEMLHRQRAWFSIAATLLFTTGWLFFVVGACAMVVLTAPGFLLFTGLLWLVATSLWVFSFIVRLCGSWYYFVPILSFATAAAATSGLVAGTGAQAGIGPGVVAAPSGTTVVTQQHKTVETGEAKIVAVPGAADTRHASNVSGTAPHAAPSNVQVAV